MKGKKWGRWNPKEQNKIVCVVSLRSINGVSLHNNIFYGREKECVEEERVKLHCTAIGHTYMI